MYRREPVEIAARSNQETFANRNFNASRWAQPPVRRPGVLVVEVIGTAPA